MRKSNRPHRRIESGEQQVLGKHIGLGERVEQRRLAGIGIADKRHDRIRHACPALTMQRARGLDRLKFLLNPVDTPLNQPAVGFQLRFTRPAEEAETAALAL